jgi:MraZ protein
MDARKQGRNSTDAAVGPGVDRTGGEGIVFVGTFEHSLDDKGRVVLPAMFRSHLAERGFVSQFDNCLGVWTEEGFADVAKRLTEKIREGLAPQDAMRAFSANAAEVKPDSQGRILLPQRLRDFAGLERDVVVIGAIDRIEIWDSSRWGDVSARADESLIHAVTALGI